MKRKKKLKKSYRILDKSDILFNEADFINSCAAKKKYESEWQAKFTADEQYEKFKVILSWYKCEYCGKWHLTSNGDNSRR